MQIVDIPPLASGLRPDDEITRRDRRGQRSSRVGAEGERGGGLSMVRPRPAFVMDVADAGGTGTTDENTPR
jgi:hypothetical protein